MRTVVTAKRLWDGTGLLERPLVAIEDGRIVSITPAGVVTVIAANDVIAIFTA